MKVRAAVVADKISIEERSLKYFFIAWVIFMIALAVRLGLSIQQYVEYQNNPLLQPAPYIQKPQKMPYVVICYDTSVYSFVASICYNATLTSAEFSCNSSLLVASNSVTQCVLFNSLLEVELSTTSAYLSTVLILTNTTIIANFPTKAFITYNIVNTSDYIANLADVSTIIPLYVNYPVFVGIQKQENVALNGTSVVTYSTSISNAPYYAPPVGTVGPNAATLQLLIYFTSYTVNKLTEVNPLGIFDIISSLGGIYSIIGAISGVLFVATVKSTPKKFVLQKEKPSEY